MGLTAPPLDTESTVQRSKIDARHITYQSCQQLWFDAQALYVGGAAIKASAHRFLRRRPKEDSTVFQHRLDGFSYENNLGTALGWYEAALFQDEPSITIRHKTGDAQTDAKFTSEQTGFYHDRFLKNCDRKGTTFINLFRTIFNSMLLYQHAYICVDLPIDDGAASLQDQKDRGLLDPYLCALTPLDIINWDLDDYGNLRWCVLYSKNERQDFLGTPERVERWYFYNQQICRVYEAITDLSNDASIQAQSSALTAVTESIQTDTSDKAPVKLLREGPHVLAKFNMVPILRVGVPEGWWFANRAILPAMEHVDISNVLHWSLFTAGLALPVVFTDDEISTLTMSEVGFWKFGIGSDVKFLEPSGKVWDELARRANVLKEEVWRACYLVSMARNTSATAAAQSGVSKQQDAQPSYDVLNGLGELIRATMQFVLGIVAKVRTTLPGGLPDADLTFDVRGFNFEDKASADDIAIVEDLLNMRIPSNRFYKELCMMAVRAGLKDINPDRLKEIDDEIEQAPSREDQQQQLTAQQEAAQQQQMRTQMTQIMRDDPEGES